MNPGLPGCRRILYRLSHQGVLGYTLEPDEPGRLSRAVSSGSVISDSGVPVKATPSPSSQITTGWLLPGAALSAPTWQGIHSPVLVSQKSNSHKTSVYTVGCLKFHRHILTLLRSKTPVLLHPNHFPISLLSFCQPLNSAQTPVGVPGSYAQGQRAYLTLPWFPSPPSPLGLDGRQTSFVIFI